MANQEHLDILKQGVETWNLWRKEHPHLAPDLSGANLRNVDLSHANLRSANLIGVDLIGVNLSSSIFTRANLRGANLSYTNLCLAKLIRAKLVSANLSSSNLSWSDLSRADLIEANLSGANLHLTNLSETNLGWTLFGNVDLSTVRGLETVRHRGPLTLGIDTIYCSNANIPEVFLRGAGVPDSLIEYMRSLVGKPIDFYSCFISYSSKDQEFVERLYADLQNKGVRCWFAPEDLKTGDKIRDRIDQSIHLHDKLLLVLSEHSVKSAWVEFEVEAAIAKENSRNTLMLFPIRLDSAVKDSPTSWAAHIRRTRNITDFSNWKQHDAYQKVFNRLLRDLKPESENK